MIDWENFDFDSEYDCAVAADMLEENHVQHLANFLRAEHTHDNNYRTYQLFGCDFSPLWPKKQTVYYFLDLRDSQPWKIWFTVRGHRKMFSRALSSGECDVRDYLPPHIKFIAEQWYDAISVNNPLFLCAISDYRSSLWLYSSETAGEASGASDASAQLGSSNDRQTLYKWEEESREAIATINKNAAISNGSYLVEGEAFGHYVHAVLHYLNRKCGQTNYVEELKRVSVEGLPNY